MMALIESLGHGGLAALTEWRTLGLTLKRRTADVHPGTPHWCDSSSRRCWPGGDPTNVVVQPSAVGADDQG